MKTSQEQALAEVTQLFLNFRGIRVPNQTDQWNEVDRYMTNLVEEGWTRKDLFHLMYDINSPQGSLPEESYDAASNYLDGLLGTVHYSCITRLPGEPTDVNELAAYVLGMEWMK